MFVQQGMAPKHIAILAEAIAQCSERAAAPQSLFELVLSGPEVPGVPTADTAATIQTLIEHAETEIVLVGYAVHNGKKLFKRLAERLDAAPTLRVVLPSTSPGSKRTRHWPARSSADFAATSQTNTGPANGSPTSTTTRAPYPKQLRHGPACTQSA